MKNLTMFPVSDEEDLKRCLKIRNDVFVKEKGVPESIETDEYDCLNEQCEHFLAEYEGQDAGTIRCRKISDSVRKIQRFCVYNRFRKNGLGKAVVEYIESYYRNQGITTMIVDAKYEAHGFYEKCGYKKVSDVFMEAGTAHIKMEKQID